MTEAKSTETGYINKNNQRNNGITPHEGTDNNQYFYEMERLIVVINIMQMEQISGKENVLLVKVEGHRI